MRGKNRYFSSFTSAQYIRVSTQHKKSLCAVDVKPHGAYKIDRGLILRYRHQYPHLFIDGPSSHAPWQPLAHLQSGNRRWILSRRHPPESTQHCWICGFRGRGQWYTRLGSKSTDEIVCIPRRLQRIDIEIRVMRIQLGARIGTPLRNRIGIGIGIGTGRNFSLPAPYQISPLLLGEFDGLTI